MSLRRRLTPGPLIGRLQIQSTDGQLWLVFLGLRRLFRPTVRAGLRVADSLGQHLA